MGLFQTEIMLNNIKQSVNNIKLKSRSISRIDMQTNNKLHYIPGSHFLSD